MQATMSTCPHACPLMSATVHTVFVPASSTSTAEKLLLQFQARAHAVSMCAFVVLSLYVCYLSLNACLSLCIGYSSSLCLFLPVFLFLNLFLLDSLLFAVDVFSVSNRWTLHRSLLHQRLVVPSRRQLHTTCIRTCRWSWWINFSVPALHAASCCSQ